MNILLVEDELVTLTACEHFLAKLGHSTTGVQDGDEAWRLFETGSYPVIISDWMLPGKSGIELCAEIRSRKTKEYPYFILITSLQGPDKIRAAMDAGVDDFLSKPIDLGTLTTRLRVAQRILDFSRQIGILEKLLPICMYCKRIRNDHENWLPVESYFKSHAGPDFSHSICPDCYATRVIPELREMGIGDS